MTSNQTPNVMPGCERCGKMFESVGQPRKYCPDCAEVVQKERSRSYHYQRRHERIERGECVDCGTKKQDKSQAQIDAYIKKNLDPQMAGYVTEEQVSVSTKCHECFLKGKEKTFHKRLQREEENPGLSPEEKAARRKEKVREAGRNRRARFLAEKPDICHHCLKRPKMEGKQWCEECLTRGNKFNKRKIKERREDGKCITCGVEANGDQLCDNCKVVQRKYSKKWWDKVREERMAAGICVRCGEAPSGGDKKSCDECARKATEYARERRKNRVCIRCKVNTPEEHKRLCTECQENKKAAQTTKKKNPSPKKAATPKPTSKQATKKVVKAKPAAKPKAPKAVAPKAETPKAAPLMTEVAVTREPLIVTAEDEDTF